MTPADTLRVTLRGSTQIVVPMGPVGCGKTTLITTIYDQFQLGPFAGRIFSGSETLLGFEQRSFYSRTASERGTADTERTPISGGEQFLHLRLQDEGQQRRIADILLADISGELSNRVADHPDSAASIVSLRAAHFLPFLIDGDRLSSPKHRHSVLEDARAILRALVDGIGIAPHTQPQIVVTKWDLLSAKGENLEELTNRLAQTFSPIDSRLTVDQIYVTAARPGQADVPWAFGCASLMNSWLREPSLATPPPPLASLASGRQFDLFVATLNDPDR